MKRIAILLLFLLLYGCSKKIGDMSVDEIKNLPDNEKIVATMKTNMGDITIELFGKEAPKTVKNFAGLAEKNYYDGVTFHRVIKGFMIQGGDPTATGSGGESLWGKDFEDEFAPELTFAEEGILAMANRGPNTNSSQFFITLAPTPWLNNRHTIFGKVVEGMDVVKEIGDVKTNGSPYDKPLEDVVIKDVEIKIEKK
ncbi:MAG: peptidylprolyl isomerase [Chlorobi bacterium]|nr:peptidylprolyl isomerase [Chlorobiota bacterium]